MNESADSETLFLGYTNTLKMTRIFPAWLPVPPIFLFGKEGALYSVSNAGTLKGGTPPSSQAPPLVPAYEGCLLKEWGGIHYLRRGSLLGEGILFVRFFFAQLLSNWYSSQTPIAIQYNTQFGPPSLARGRGGGSAATSRPSGSRPALLRTLLFSVEPLNSQITKQVLS